MLGFLIYSAGAAIAIFGLAWKKDRLGKGR